MDRIVVGVDGSEGSHRALRWAAREAALRGATVEAVHAWQPQRAIGVEGLGAWDPDLFAAAAAEILDAAITEIQGLDVSVDRRIIEGPAALTLLDAAQGASLVVVGTRGHGGFLGLLLGSVSQQVAHHAPCPVVIVPDPAKAHRRRDGS